MIALEYEEAKQLLKRAVGEKGADYVYPRAAKRNDKGQLETLGTCVYFEPETGQPSCIIGHIFAYKGVTYRDVIHDNDTSGEGFEGTDFISANHFTIALLANAQDRQDMGAPWGAAVDESIEIIDGALQGDDA